MYKNNTIAVLLTCFNRKELTLNCLKMLSKQKADNFTLDIYLVDDGCTDGTSQIVRAKFPDVNIIRGTGALYWNGGMRLAWQRALSTKPDFYLWVNDDSFIYKDAVSNLLKSYENLIDKNQEAGAILGSMVDPDSKSLTYGGRAKAKGMNPLSIGKIIQPVNEAIKCDFVNGNLTLIPRNTVDRIGILSDKFTHSMGDFDYGLRAKNAGLDCWVAPGVYGECSANPIKGSWQDKSLPISERIKKMNAITQLPPVCEWKYFVKQHGGVLWPLLYLDALLRGISPKLWLILKRKV